VRTTILLYLLFEVYLTRRKTDYCGNVHIGWSNWKAFAYPVSRHIQPIYLNLGLIDASYLSGSGFNGNDAELGPGLYVTDHVDT